MDWLLKTDSPSFRRSFPLNRDMLLKSAGKVVHCDQINAFIAET